jgi:hypothetical protein
MQGKAVMNFRQLGRAVGLVLMAGLMPVGLMRGAEAATLYVSPGGTGQGSAQSPFGRIADALAQAGPGDEVVVKPGLYNERVQTVRGGSPAERLVIRAETDGTAVLTSSAGTVLRVGHPFVTVRGVVVDGQYAAFDAVIVDSDAASLLLQNIEVRRTSRDCIDMRAPADVVVEGALIHRCLNAAGGRTDAHGIVAGAVRNLTIRDTKIHSFSGDAVQLDPGRAAPGWDRVTIERCQFWLEPLAAAENGFAAGTIAGENALDTKTSPSVARAVVVVRDTEAWGFRGGLINNMAAFNVKENVDAQFDGVTVHDSEIAFRLRGPGRNGGAWARIQNAVVHDVSTAVRYEDDIERVQVWNSTFGSGIRRLFHAAEASPTSLSVQNLLFLGSGATVPRGSGNMEATSRFFADAAAHDYRLAPGSPAIDAGMAVPAVATDRLGRPRPNGDHFDVGAFEFVAERLAPGPVPPARR